MTSTTEIKNNDWLTELRNTAERYHVIACWVAIILNPIWAISDYYTTPEYWKIFLVIRLTVAITTLAALMLRNKLKISSEMLVFIPVLGISLQNAYMYSVMDVPTLQKHTFAYIALFIGVGMFMLWKPIYSIVVVIISLAANVFFFSIFSELTVQEILVNGALLTATVAIFAIFLINTRYNLTKKEIIARLALAESNAKLAVQNKIIEEKNKDITDSINYARRIQDAILPNPSFAQKALPDHFVLYKPKDIVSGDFYWIDQKDDWTLFAAVDCTGHGVPGAFVSLLGYNGLNRAVKDKAFSKPGLILDELNKYILDILKQDANMVSVKDGMDIALCGINFKEKILECASAVNPVYIVRDKEVIVIKADRFSIGGEQTEGNSFANNHYALHEGDTIYISTDGFADQFGGTKEKKFMTSRFKQLLVEINDKSMADQKQILFDTFNKWKGSFDQVDDVLVIGVRI